VEDLRLVIFDCDGVLVDSERISNDVLARRLTDAGLPTTMAQARRECQGRMLREVQELAEARLGRSLGPDWLAQYEHDRELAFRRELEPVAGAAAAVERVRAAGVDMCVASQGKLEKTRLSLELTGLRHLFADASLFSAEQVPRGKPHPDLFLHAARAMGADPAGCAVVEDTPSGVTAAVAAGMRALGYAADSDEAALREAGAEILCSLDELARMLGIA
jgi:HAD superfamily hydrolase (TIGR01509 family)